MKRFLLLGLVAVLALAASALAAANFAEPLPCISFNERGVILDVSSRADCAEYVRGHADGRRYAVGRLQATLASIAPQSVPYWKPPPECPEGQRAENVPEFSDPTITVPTGSHWECKPVSQPTPTKGTRP